MKEQKPNGRKKKKKAREKKKSGKKKIGREITGGRRVTRYPLFRSSMSFCLKCFRVIECWFALNLLLVHARFSTFREHACSFRVATWKEARTDTARQNERHSLSLCSPLFVLFLLLLSLSLLITGSLFYDARFFLPFFLQFFFHRIVLTRNSDQFFACT